MPLFVADRHEQLIDTPWREAAARTAIAHIIGDAQTSFSPQHYWRIHPLDVSPERAANALKPLYYGAAGVIWALNYLAARHAAEPGRDYAPLLDDLLMRHRADWRQLKGTLDSSFGVGDAGILLLHHKLAPTKALADALYDVIESNNTDATATGISQTAMGFVFGMSGTMLAGLFMLECTGEARWREQYLRSMDALWQAWRYIDDVDCDLWTQDLYGYVDLQIGALHGFAGNVFSMLRGQHLLTSERMLELHERAANTVQVTARHEAAFVNWPKVAAASTRPGSTTLLLQHCTGAPGIINCLAQVHGKAGEAIDALLLSGGELIWSAGPLRKIPSLCHGTPGNGYAFLKLFARTGNEVWLERARRFAMHAIAQNARAVAEHGQRKYSLWTGDLGLAVFLYDCIRGVAEIPMLDVF